MKKEKECHEPSCWLRPGKRRASEVRLHGINNDGGDNGRMTIRFFDNTRMMETPPVFRSMAKRVKNKKNKKASRPFFSRALLSPSITYSRGTPLPMSGCKATRNHETLSRQMIDVKLAHGTFATEDGPWHLIPGPIGLEIAMVHLEANDGCTLSVTKRRTV